MNNTTSSIDLIYIKKLNINKAGLIISLKIS